MPVNALVSPRIRLAVAVVAAVVACAALAAAPAHAGRTQVSVFQDEGLLQFNGPEAQRAALDEMQSLGADQIHVLVGWRNLAPGPTSTRKPSGFDGADPAQYPDNAFAALDNLVELAQSRDLELLFTPTGSIPDWASRCSAREARVKNTFTCDPDPEEYEAFVAALGKHFSGERTVSRWSFWNEPNLKSWLRPQYKRVRGRNIPWSPHMYRALAQGGIRALRSTGHASDQILAGEAAPIGLQSGNANSASMAPGIFYREMFCLDSRGRRFRGPDASARGCSRPKAFAIKGVSHHPYAKGGSKGPTATVRNPQEITVGYIGRLQRIISQAGRARVIPRGLDIYYTEYGVQTSPPDTFFGVSLTKQAEFINESDYMSWRNRDVRSVAQYNLVDDASDEGFNTGLVFNPNTRAGARKPSYDAYRTPIYVIKGSGDQVKVWGQARPAGPGARVEIQSGSGSDWTTVQAITTGTQGYFQVNVTGPGPRWRLKWTPRGENVDYFSREAVPRSEPRERR